MSLFIVFFIILQLIVNVMDCYNKHYRFFRHRCFEAQRFGKLQWLSSGLWKGSDWVSTFIPEDGKISSSRNVVSEKFKLKISVQSKVVCCIPLAPRPCSNRSRLNRWCFTFSSFPSLSFSLRLPFHSIQLLFSIQFCSVNLIIHFVHLRLSIFFTRLVIF
jgi:hypothetical protein